MPGSPLVSVGLPTYNRPKGLEKAIKYLISQDYQNIEIIISDNCSTNTSVREILLKYASTDQRISFFIQTENIEIEPNFNFVYHKAQGKYFMWIADDDEFDKNYISACVDFLEQNSDYVLCTGTSRYYARDEFLFNEKKIVLSDRNPVARLFKYFTRVNKNGVFYGLYRNSLAFENPIQKHIGADWDHVARTALLGKINVLESIGMRRSDDGGSSSRGKIAARWKVSPFKKLFLETYMAYEVAKYIFNEPVVKKKYNILLRLVIQGFVFILLNLKFLLNSIGRRLK